MRVLMRGVRAHDSTEEVEVRVDFLGDASRDRRVDPRGYSFWRPAPRKERTTHDARSLPRIAGAGPGSLRGKRTGPPTNVKFDRARRRSR